MKHLIPIIKKVELEVRSFGQIKSKELWEELSQLSDWDYRVITAEIVRINLWIKNNNLNFVYKYLEKHWQEIYQNQNKEIDLLIACTKRDQNDTVLTDVWNRLYVPQELKHDVIEIWGYAVTQARNFAVETACKRGAKYLLFVDDDIVAPNNALVKLYQLMKETGAYVTAGDYFKKMEPLDSAHCFDKEDSEKVVKRADLCAMGLTLIDLEKVGYEVPFPLFWEFGAPDGFWSMGEDAFFTKNLLEYTGQKPLVDTSIATLHYDKTWKRSYGVRDIEVTYATNWIPDVVKFERLRVPNTFPLIIIGIPTRTPNDPIMINLEELKMLRGYRSELIRVTGMKVDDARNALAEEALKKGADYLLFIDDDIILPHDGLEKMLAHIEKPGIDIVSGDYLLKGKPFHSAHLNLNKDGLCTELERLDDNREFLPCNWMIGNGAVLIDMDFFKQARKPWFMCNTKNPKFEGQVGEDAYFTELALENGFSIYVDKSIKCIHVDIVNQTLYAFDKFERNEYAMFSEVFNWKKVIMNG